MLRSYAPANYPVTGLPLSVASMPLVGTALRAVRSLTDIRISFDALCSPLPTAGSESHALP